MAILSYSHLIIAILLTMIIDDTETQTWIVDDTYAGTHNTLTSGSRKAHI